MFTRLFLILLTFFCAASLAQAQTAPQLITPTALQAEMKSAQKPFLIDVREPPEYDEGHIDGATLLPLGMLPDHLAELPKDKEIVVYCRSGKRSAAAATLLQQNGFTKVRSLDGGFLAWPQK